MDEQVERVARLVEFVNLPGVDTAADVHRVVALFAQDPGVRRTVFETDPGATTPIPVQRAIIFGPSVAPNERHASSTPAPFTLVNSGSVLPGQMLWVRDTVIGTLHLGRSPALRSDEQLLPTTDHPERYVTCLEADRQHAGRMLRSLAQGDSRAEAEVRSWAELAYAVLVMPYAHYNPDASSRARLWLSGVQAVIAQTIADLLTRADLRRRLRMCALKGCESVLFLSPETVGPPRKYCGDAHAQRARDDRRGR